MLFKVQLSGAKQSKKEQHFIFHIKEHVFGISSSLNNNTERKLDSYLMKCIQ